MREAVKKLTDELVRHIREDSPESDSALNDASRAVITAMHERKGGPVYLGLINSRESAGEQIMREHDGGMVYNFEADFVLPNEDERVYTLIFERLKGPYKGMRDDSARVKAIHDAIEKAGGELLFWS